VLTAPDRESPIEARQPHVRASHPEQQAERDPTDDNERHASGQQQACSDGRIHARAYEAPK
jgi:hypothetical protein